MEPSERWRRPPSTCQRRLFWLEGEEEPRPAGGCPPQIKDSVFPPALLSVSGNYTGELLDNATTTRRSAVRSVFSFQGCHAGETKQRTCRRRRGLRRFDGGAAARSSARRFQTVWMVHPGLRGVQGLPGKGNLLFPDSSSSSSSVGLIVSPSQ